MGVDITVDSFKLSLPSQSSYPDPNALCNELVHNGDAETNGFNPYPMVTSKTSESITIVEEGGNKFWRLSDRSSHSSSIKYYVDTTCLTRGVTYMFSSKVRLRLTYGFVGGAEEIYWFINFNGNNKDIVNCDTQSASDGWVTCTGTFTIDEELSQLLQDSSANLRMSFRNTRDGSRYDVDYDDISISYHKGYVDELIVDNSDVSCWGNDADIHVTSAVYYSSSSEKSNGFVTKIESVTDNGDGSASLILKNAATLPIISEEDSIESAVDIALLSRNVIVEGVKEVDEDDKGGYMQVIHTPDIPQKIQGVWFINMGRKSEVDRFVSNIYMLRTQFVFNVLILI